MYLTTKNVNTAFREIIGSMYSDDGVDTVEQPSWQGDTIQIPKPVYVTYTHPMERVLFNVVRDANPFFMLYEALWMLAGREDVKALSFYNSKISSYSDNGVTFNGAYGKRWRDWNGYADSPDKVVAHKADQLKIIIDHLRCNEHSRRAVLQMWDVNRDLLNIGSNICPTCRGIWTAQRAQCPNCNRNVGDPFVPDQGSKDICCNLNICFQIREGKRGGGIDEQRGPFIIKGPVLDMTVFNRSNDVLWGMLGSDYVCFSILQEYMADAIGIHTGVYHHISNNLHAYKSRWNPDKWLSYYENPDLIMDYGYGTKTLRTVPLVADRQVFDYELPQIVETFSGHEGNHSWGRTWREPFFNEVARPLFLAHGLYKMGNYLDAINSIIDPIYGCQADDWRFAALGWLGRRVYKGENRCITRDKATHKFIIGDR